MCHGLDDIAWLNSAVVVRATLEGRRAARNVGHGLDDIARFSGLHWRAARNVGHGLDDIARLSGLHWRAGGLHGMWVMVWMTLHGSQGYIGGQEGCTECGSWFG